MKALFSLVIILSGVFYADTGISMMGLKINDPQKSLKQIKLKVVSREDETVKYRTENGNDFSVTIDQGRIVFMQNDWQHNLDDDQPLFSNFKFGKTSLKDIRKAFGSGGYSYDQRDNLTTDEDIIEFTCFEFDSPNNEVLVTITKAAIDDKLTTDRLPESLKLDGIIIADKQFMDAIWGTRKHYTPNYKKINPDGSQAP